MSFREYVVTPEALVPDLENDSERRGLHRGVVKSLLRELGRVGLLRGESIGAWKAKISEIAHPETKAAITALFANRRIVESCEVDGRIPQSEADWRSIAERSARNLPLFAFVSADESACRSRTLVRTSGIGRLTEQNWWNDRSESWLIRRSKEDFDHELNVPLRHANSLVFIDPYFNPALERYFKFIEVLEPAGSRNSPPCIEIHTAVHPKRPDAPTLELLISEFVNLESKLTKMRLSLNVTIWNSNALRHTMHDRFLLTDLGSFSCSNGFEISPHTKMLVAYIPRELSNEVRLRIHPNFQRPVRAFCVGDQRGT